MIRGLAATVLWSLMAGIVAIGLFLIKQDVKGLETRLTTINRHIAQDRSELHVLHAEWSYLDEPSRLRVLAERYLKVKPIGITQIATLNDLPAPGADTGPVVAERRPGWLADSAVKKKKPAPALAQAQPSQAQSQAIASAGAPPLTLADVAPETGAR